MHSLPIFQTVSRTFGFVIERRFFTLLRLIWLPVFLSVAVAALPIAYQFSHIGFPPDPEKMRVLQEDGVFTALQWVNMIASVILGAVTAISVHRLILLDDRQPGVFFYWRLTREEWLYVLAWIGYFILAMVAFLIPLMAHFYYVTTYEGDAVQKLAAAFVAATEAPKPDAAAYAAVFKKMFADPRTTIALCMSFVFLLIALARFGLVFPIIVAEGRLSFWRTWVLTRGNTLQLIGFWIVTVVLTWIVSILLALVLAAAVAGIFAAVAAGGQTAGALGIVLLSVPAVLSFITYFVIGITMFIAAMSYSYKALAEPEAAG